MSSPQTAAMLATSNSAAGSTLLLLLFLRACLRRARRLADHNASCTSVFGSAHLGDDLHATLQREHLVVCDLLSCHDDGGQPRSEIGYER